MSAQDRSKLNLAEGHYHTAQQGAKPQNGATGAFDVAHRPEMSSYFLDRRGLAASLLPLLISV